jgi:hypothetical protein
MEKIQIVLPKHIHDDLVATWKIILKILSSSKLLFDE